MYANKKIVQVQELVVYFNKFYMGAEVCRNAQHDQNNEIQTKTAGGNCLHVCYNTSTENDIKNKQKIEPITFSDQGSDRNTPKNKQQQSNVIQAVGGGLTHRNGEQNRQHFEQSSTHSNFQYKGEKATALRSGEQTRRSDDVLVVNKDSKGNIQFLNSVQRYEPISVPFSVIKLVIKPQILRQIKKIERDFVTEHGNPYAETFLTWKLLHNGCYINKISDGRTIILTENKYYRGITERNSNIPEDLGTMITMQGSYQGNFKQGQAHGQGVYISIGGKKKISGNWRNGQLEKGKLQTQQYRYDGDFKNSRPHGRGVLRILKTNAEYSGLFIEGKFEDEQGVYSCNKYVYKGGFVRGKKHGQGILTFKQKSGNGKNSKKLKGIFEQDVFKVAKP